MAVGAASVLSPAYISEVAPAEIRGRLTTVQQIMIITGLTAAFVVNYFLAAGAGVSTATFWFGLDAWRWMFLMQALPAAIFLVALFLIPESPRFLVSKGRDDQAASVLTRLFGGDIARAKLEEIRATFSAEHRPRLSRRPHARRRPRLSRRSQDRLGRNHAAVFQQLVGINVIFYYGATLWQLAGFTEDAVAADQHRLRRGVDRRLLRDHRVIDKIGRKPLLLIGSAGMAVTLFTMVYAFSHGSLDPQGNLVLSKASAWSPSSPPTSTSSSST